MIEHTHTVAPKMIHTAVMFGLCGLVSYLRTEEDRDAWFSPLCSSWCLVSHGVKILEKRSAKRVSFTKPLRTVLPEQHC